MNKESIIKPIIGGLIPLGILTLTGLLVSGAFSDRTRRLIHQRDHDRSVLSGKTEHLECAHLNHNKGYSKYNDPSNGRLLEISEHYLDHLNRAGRNGLTESQNNWALGAIWGRMNEEERDMIRNKGYREP